MADQTGTDIIKRLESLAADRVEYDAKCQQVAELAVPDAGDFLGMHSTVQRTLGINIPQAAKRSAYVYDSTAAYCVDRLSPGIEGLIAPKNEYWHGVAKSSIFGDLASDEEKQYFERMRNTMFSMRYDTDSGWSSSFQACIRRAVAFGIGLQFIDENTDGKSYVDYRLMPLNRTWIATDSKDNVDTVIELYNLSARAAVRKFGNERVSEKIRVDANDPGRMDKQHTFVRMISPVGDFGQSGGIAGRPFAAVHVELNEKNVVMESGYFEFPVVAYRWGFEPGTLYPEGAVMRVLGDIQSLNNAARDELTGSAQAIRPPLLMANAGVMNRPSSNPNQIIFGGLNRQGQEMVKPMNTGVRLDFSRALIEAKRNELKDSLYINLFQVLVESPQMTATEAIIRANEKGELLGPPGASLQGSLSTVFDREVGIMGRRGFFDQESPLAPPASLSGQAIEAEMTSPLDRLRKVKEAEGTMRTLEVVAPVMNIDESVAHVFDGHEMIRGLGEIFGMPKAFVRSREAVEADRQAEAEAVQQQAAVEQAAQAAQAGKLGSEALANLQETGI